MANGVVLIAGIGTVLLWCLDHNSGDEKVITLTQVLHMPGATARLISMGEMLQRNYKVTGDKRGISLTHKAERCHAPNRFGTVNMEDNVYIKRS